MPIYITKKQTPLQAKEATAGTSDISVTPDDGYEGMTSVTVHPTNHTGTYTPSPNTAVNDMGASHNKRYVNTSGMIVPSGNKSISENGTNIDVASYSTVSVSVPSPTLSGDAAKTDVLSGKTFYNTSTTKQTGSMTNNGAWTSTGNKANASTTKNVTIPAGYHNGSGYVQLASLSSQTGVDSGKTAIDASHVVTGYQGWVNGTKISGSYNLPSGTKDNTGSPLTTNGDHTISGLDSYTGIKVNVNVPNPTLSGTATASDVLATKTFYSDSYTKQTGSITSKAAATYNTSSSDQTISAGQYLSGAQTIKAVTTENISAANIKQGVTVKVGDANDDDRILSVTGTYTPTPTETLLWQNSSPSTAISYTTVTLSESIQNFDYIKVVGQVNPSSDTTEIIAIMPVSEFINIKESNTTTGTAFLLAYQKGSSERHYRHVFYVSNTQVKFSRSDAGTSGTSARTMPYKIYGVKY